MVVVSDNRLRDTTASELGYIPDVVSAQDYYSFGSLQPGRSWSLGGNYRYGFNGKENDNEVKGEGNQQDYGMRIYDPRLGKFLSVDPITSKYPSLTPYQFASNRPIDGVDIDGKEYGTIHITTNDKDSPTYNYVPYDPTASNLYGDRGAGVIYDVTMNFKLPDGSFGAHNHQHFVPRKANILGLFYTDYGNYYGGTTLFQVNKYGQLQDDPRLNSYAAKPVSSVDYFAMNHDKGYDLLGAVGSNSLFNDWGTTPIDEKAQKGWNNFVNKYKVGGTDPYTFQKITTRDMTAASNGSTLFSMIVFLKKRDISTFMVVNYSEAKSSFWGGDKEYNYKLFLEKYLNKDSSGNYTRKENMWTQDSDGNFTPNKPKK